MYIYLEQINSTPLNLSSKLPVVLSRATRAAVGRVKSPVSEEQVQFVNTYEKGIH